ncbi:MAG TPA: hypothetical protein VLD67_02305 [Vicinamibacterales bacterium]|nr:hypothetical protein [Vicinamibacterales bacterium]
MSHGGRPGPPAGRLGVPLVAPPPSPTGVAARPTERSIMVEWQPPVTEPGGPAVSFNVYRPAGDGLALNAAPLAGETYEHPAAMGEEQCFAVRSVILVQSVQIESELSAASCVTPRDVFPPEAPRGLQAVAAAEGIELSWNANTEADLAGYVVLRGEAPGDTLQPLTPAPIRETTYRDTSTTSGVRYVYAVIAVDTATPPNASPQSARQEVTAR